MKRFCDGLAWTLSAIAFTSLVLIVVALAGQVIFRYVLRAPLSHSDEIAQTALVWLTFAGAAYLYRERGHVEIDFLFAKLSPRAAHGVSVLVELAILAAMVLICVQVLQTREVMQRVIYGTLRMPKFLLHFLPLLISAASTAVFTVEAITKSKRA